MKTKYLLITLIISIITLNVTTVGFAQDITRIRGKVIDANTKEPLPL